MSDTSRKINAFFRNASRADVSMVKSEILLSERQERILEMFYIKRHDVGFIADTLGCAPVVVYKELAKVRKKISDFISNSDKN